MDTIFMNSKFSKTTILIDCYSIFTRVKLAAGGQPPTAAKNINKLKEF